MRHLHVFLLVGLVSTGLALAQDERTPPEGKKTNVEEKVVRALIDQLGDESFEVREAAHKRLMGVGEPALELLKKAAKVHADLEVRERLGQLIQSITETIIFEVRRFEGRQTYSHRLAVTPDGTQVVAVSNGTLRCLNLADGKATASFDFPADLRNTWAFGLARDGRQVIVGSDDLLARVYDVKTGKLINILKGHTVALWGVALLKDGKQALTGGGDQSLRVWDVASGQQVRAFDNVSQNVQSMQISPDGKTVAVAHSTSNDYRDRGFEDPGTIRIWDLESGRELRALNGHTNRLCSVRFSADGKTLLSSSYDKTVRLWDVATGKLLKTFEGHTGRAQGAVFTTDGKRFLSIGGEANILIMWDIASGAILFQTPPTGTGFVDVAALADGHHCVTGGYDGAIRVWQWKR